MATLMGTQTPVTNGDKANRPGALDLKHQAPEISPEIPSAAMTRLCHDLRQPLQTLVLLQSLLTKSVENARAQDLVKRFGTSLDAMTAILNLQSHAIDEMRVEDHPADVVVTQIPPGPPTEVSIAGLAHSPACHNAATLETFRPVVFVVDDDRDVRAAIRSVLENDGQTVEEFASCEEFLKYDRRNSDGCLLVDAYLPGMGGLELLHRLQSIGHTLPAIMITGNSDVPMAVEAMKAGAVDFIEKPIGRDELLASIKRATDHSKDLNKRNAWRSVAARHLAGLSARQRQVMQLVLAGHPSKNIAADLGISQRTVENHRASIMKRTGTKSLPELARLAIAATQQDRRPDDTA